MVPVKFKKGPKCADDVGVPARAHIWDPILCRSRLH